MKKLVLFSISLLILGSCATTMRPTASATLASTSGSTAMGTVKFVQLADGSVQVTADLSGVPQGVHGFHIHEKGDCGNNAMNSGGHFNPTGMIHGAPDAVSHHAGDFGNVTADANGEVHIRFTTHSISLTAGDVTNPIGHAVVLHASPDDLVSQPAGNAGARIACGVVQTTSGM